MSQDEADNIPASFSPDPAFSEAIRKKIAEEISALNKEIEELDQREEGWLRSEASKICAWTTGFFEGFFDWAALFSIGGIAVMATTGALAVALPIVGVPILIGILGSCIYNGIEHANKTELVECAKLTQKEAKVATLKNARKGLKAILEKTETDKSQNLYKYYQAQISQRLQGEARVAALAKLQTAYEADPTVWFNSLKGTSAAPTLTPPAVEEKKSWEETAGTVLDKLGYLLRKVRNTFSVSLITAEWIGGAMLTIVGSIVAAVAAPLVLIFFLAFMFSQGVFWIGKSVMDALSDRDEEDILKIESQSTERLKQTLGMSTTLEQEEILHYESMVCKDQESAQLKKLVNRHNAVLETRDANDAVAVEVGVYDGVLHALAYTAIGLIVAAAIASGPIGWFGLAIAGGCGFTVACVSGPAFGWNEGRKEKKARDAELKQLQKAIHTLRSQTPALEQSVQYQESGRLRQCLAGQLADVLQSNGTVEQQQEIKEKLGQEEKKYQDQYQAAYQDAIGNSTSTVRLIRDTFKVSSLVSATLAHGWEYQQARHEGASVQPIDPGELPAPRFTAADIFFSIITLGIYYRAMTLSLQQKEQHDTRTAIVDECEGIINGQKTANTARKYVLESVDKALVDEFQQSAKNIIDCVKSETVSKKTVSANNGQQAQEAAVPQTILAYARMLMG